MGRFDDRATQPQRGPWDMLRWRIGDTIAGRRMKDPGGFTTPRRENDGRKIAELPASLTWIGHATFAVKLAGKLIATDPVWSERVGPIRRKVAPGVALEALPPFDVVTVSHNHYDHLDKPSIARLGDAPLYVTPLGNGSVLKSAGAKNVVELDWWQTHRHDRLEITCVPAAHWSMRAPWNRNDMLWGGFVVRGPEGAFHHAGDTALPLGADWSFADIGKRAGPIDWALLPVGAYEPRWFMQPQHMNPEDAVEAFAQLGARTMVAMHWGTFKLTDEPLGEPPERTRRVFAERGLDAKRLWVLDVGETRAL